MVIFISVSDLIAGHPHFGKAEVMENVQSHRYLMFSPRDI